MMGTVEVTAGTLRREASAQPAVVKKGFPEKAIHKLDLEDKEGVPRAEDREGCPSYKELHVQRAERSPGVGGVPLSWSLQLKCGV